MKDNQTCLEMIADKSPGSQMPKLKIDVGDDSEGPLKDHSASNPDVNSPKVSPDPAKSTGVVMEAVSRNCKGNDLVVCSLQCGDKKSVDVAQNEGELSECNGKDVNFSTDPRNHKEDTNGSEGSTLLRKSLSEPKPIFCDDELSKSGVSVSSASPSSKLRVAISLKKSPSSGSSIVISKSSSSNKSKPPDTRNVLSVVNQAAADFREHAPSTITTGGVKNDVIRKTDEDSLSHSSRILHTPVSKGNASDSKDFVVSSSSKSSSAQNVSAKLGSADSTNMQSQRAFAAQNRAVASGLSSKVGKSNHSALHPSLKGNHATAAHQPVVSNSPAGLSDEEVCTLPCPFLIWYLLSKCLYDLAFLPPFLFAACLTFAPRAQQFS